MGRKYDEWLTPEGLLLLEGWARDGLTEKQIAANCRCSPATLRDWMDRFPAIAEALRKGHRSMDYAVENAVLHAALGYDYTEETTTTESSEKGGETERRSERKRHAKPNIQAARFWLINRQPEKWGGRPLEEGQEGGCVILPEVRDDG